MYKLISMLALTILFTGACQSKDSKKQSLALPSYAMDSVLNVDYSILENIRIDQLVSIAYRLRSMSDYKHDNLSVKRGTTFDFASFELSQENDGRNIDYEVFYSNGEVYKISQLSAGLWNFEYHVFDTTGFKLFFITHFGANPGHNEELASHITGFIVYDKEKNRFYFLGFQKGLSKYYNISIIMILDNNLKPQRQLWYGRLPVNPPHLQRFTKFIYCSNGFLCYEEELRINSPFKLKAETQLGEFTDCLNDTGAISIGRTYTPSINPDYKEIPFWFFAGRILYNE